MFIYSMGKKNNKCYFPINKNWRKTKLINELQLKIQSWWSLLDLANSKKWKAENGTFKPDYLQ